MEKKYFLENGTFKINAYDRLPAFSSFLPGIAGKKGIPLWVFYTNRGQAVNSFGIHHKGNAIMEFNPANTAYENTPVKGFRTFLRVNGSFYEPFRDIESGADRTMSVEQNLVSVEELNQEKKIHIKAAYYVLPHENIGALVRDVTITNTGGETAALEVLDGMPKIIPYGIQNGMFKEMSNLFKSWTEVRNIENNAPFYTQRASSDDSAEVKEIEGGYYYVSIMDGKTVPPVYDPDVIFGCDNSLVTPVCFAEEGIEGVSAREQYFVNKIPCGFTPCRKKLAPGEKIHFTTYIGFSGSVELLNEKVREFAEKGYGEAKMAEAGELTKKLVQDVATHTALEVFDKYVEQCYLDNFLRGGYPFIFNADGNKKTVHLYSRKHGDPERDYNFFSIAGEYYSQGNGNFRDVCQNRRNDVFFNPGIEDFNIMTFFSLIQMDGYNPLEIRPSTFLIPEDKRARARELAGRHVKEDKGVLEKLISGRFTPGQIAQAIAVNGLKVTEEDSLIEGLLDLSSQEIEAGFGEGYWSDHWDYLLDLVDSYLAVYPDKQEELLFGSSTYRVYDSPGVVRPRRETYVLSAKGPRQYGSMYHDPAKAARPGFTENGTNWLKTADGELVETTLFGKMLILAVNKFALLDSSGMGIEMEGGKPGWNDAMNGLPGLFGSSMAETLELERLVRFMTETLEQVPEDAKWEFPEEPVRFLRRIKEELDLEQDDFTYWDHVAQLREAYRESIRYCTGGAAECMSALECKEILYSFLKKLNQASAKAMEAGCGIMPTYFTYEAVRYEILTDEEGKEVLSPYGLPAVKVLEFEQRVLPYFLEGPARYLSAAGRKNQEAAQMCRKIAESDLYDRKLKMYKTSVSIEELSMENGRVRAFTPGWLERESIFLHMEYKYFLGMLEAGLYEQFWEALKEALIPFRKPEEYGRSILENSSFLASSANPDPHVHGRGFVARLSGSTVEMLSMWLKMFLGEKGFTYEDGTLKLTLRPVLPAWLFDENGEASFTLLKSVKVVYHNTAGRNTYGQDGVSVLAMTLTTQNRSLETEGNVLSGEWAQAVRTGEVKRIDAYLG